MVERTQQRSCLFFDRWQLCAKFSLPEARVLYGLDHDRIDYLVTQRRSWGKRLVVKNHGGSWKHCLEPLVITDQQQRDLHAVCDVLRSASAPHKITLYHDSVRVYTNDRDFIRMIDEHGIMRLAEVVAVDVTGVKGAVQLKNSDHSLRSYFRARLLTDHTANSVKQFLLCQESVRLSPTLTQWCKQPRYVFTRRYFFIDHHEHSTVNMLDLIQPGLVRITQPILVDK